MGNTNSTSSVHSVEKARSLSSSRRKLKRFGSSATLAKIYQHHNMSMPCTKAMAWKSQYGDKILDISKPTKFEHGIHVEYDDDSGKFMGLPDVWQTNFPSDDILDTTLIHPALVPTTENMDPIGKPFNFQHNIHVEIDRNGIGYKGLPKEWQDVLSAAQETQDILPSRTSSLKENVLKTVQIIQEQERGKQIFARVFFVYLYIYRKRIAKFNNNQW